MHDLPGGAPRLTRPAGGFRLTAVGGVVTQEGGVATGARPGGPLDEPGTSVGSDHVR